MTVEFRILPEKVGSTAVVGLEAEDTVNRDAKIYNDCGNTSARAVLIGYLLTRCTSSQTGCISDLSTLIGQFVTTMVL